MKDGEPTRLNKWIGKIAGYKINTQKFLSFLYTHNEVSERETKKNKSIYYCNKKIRYLGINLTKEVKDLYLENYRPLKKEVGEDARKWKHILCSWIGRIKIIKMFILPKAIPIKIPVTYFTELEQIF